MTRPASSAEHFLHLDGYNGWYFAEGGDTQALVSPSGLELPAGSLPTASVAPDVMSKARARGLAFDRLGRPYAVREDRRGFCAFGGSDAVPECIVLPDAKRLGGLAIDGRGRLFVALPEHDEVRVFRLFPGGAVTSVGGRRPVAVATDGLDRLFVLERGAVALPPLAESAGFDVVHVVRPRGDSIAVSGTGAIAVATRGLATVDVALDGTNFVAIDLGRPALPAIAFADEGDALVLCVGDAMSGRVVRWRITETGAEPLSWSRQVDAWTALAYRGRTLHGLGRACCPAPLEWESAGFFARRAQVVIGPLDSGTPGTEWHRITASVELPTEGTAELSAEILSSDDVRAYDPLIGVDDPRWEAPRPLAVPSRGAPAELAFRDARGRYAFLRLTLSGDGRHTPRVRWVRVEYPRNSYLRFLPSIYSEEPESRAFTARFLSIFEASNASLSSSIDELSRLFQPFSVEPRFLPWLAERLGVSLEPGWSEETMRRVLAGALRLHRRRGTRAALSTLLEDAGVSGASIVEGSRRRTVFLLGSGYLGCDSVLPGGCKPPRIRLDRGVRLGAGRLDASARMEADPIVEQSAELTVFVPPATATPDVLSRASRIATREAPAGTLVKVVGVKPNARLGAGTRLGLDAALGGHGVFRLLEDADPGGVPLPLLLSREPGTSSDLTLGNGPRLGMDSKL